MQKAVLTLAFDDGYLDTYEHAISCIDKVGIKCTFAVPAGLIGKRCENRPVLEWRHLEEMAGNGHEIASHSLHHLNFKIQNTESKINPCLYGRQAKPQIQNSKQILEKKLGIKIESFVYPYIDSLPAKNIRDIVKKNYSSSRISKNFPVFNILPIKNPHNLKGFCIMSMHSLKFLSNQINRIVKEKLWLIEVFHLVGRKNTKSVHGNRMYRFFMHIDDFKRHIDFVVSKNIKIMTQDEVIGYENPDSKMC